jgi:hypothetical protein
VFTKLTRPLIKHWRAQGWDVFIYIDDRLSVTSSLDRALLISCQILGDLERAGFVINVLKSHWEPVKRIQWVGFIIDSAEMKFFLFPQTRFSVC